MTEPMAAISPLPGTGQGFTAARVSKLLAVGKGEIDNVILTV